jgi:5-methylcytosine-specific restriction endonuclease McrA
MRRIDKKLQTYPGYLTEYEENKKQSTVPDYDSNHRWYLGLKAAMLICQHGICAYSETQLCDPEDIKKLHLDWSNPNFAKTNLTRDELPGEIDHFSPKSKEIGGRWEWDNLFVTDGNTNRKKSTFEAPDYLKPDLPDYSPDKYLVFDRESGKFTPNPSLPESEKKEVQAFASKVLNHTQLVTNRKNVIEELLHVRELSPNPTKEYRIEDGYPTAWRMALQTYLECDEE